MTPTQTPTDNVDNAVPLHHALPAVVVHTALRREFHLALALVRRVDPGDTGRAAIVARHLDFLLRALQHHHELEDEMIWPALRCRAPERIFPIVDVMESQHEEIHRLVGRIRGLLPSWAEAASAGTRDRMAEQLAALSTLLAEHFDLEERAVLPEAERHLTVTEWRTIGEKAEAGNPKNERALVFGMLQYEGDPEVVASMIAGAPLPVRMFVPRLGRRAYRRHAIAVHGTPTP